MRVAIALALVSIGLSGQFESQRDGRNREDVRDALRSTNAAVSFRSAFESLQSLDSLTMLMENHGSFGYEIRPDHNRSQKVIQTISAVQIRECILTWRVTSVSAGISRISLASDLRALDLARLRFGELRGPDAPIHISFVPSIWELEIPIVGGNVGPSVHSRNMDTGVDTPLSSLYLMIDTADGAKQVADVLKRKIERCKKAPAS